MCKYRLANIFNEFIASFKKEPTHEEILAAIEERYGANSVDSGKYKYVLYKKVKSYAIVTRKSLVEESYNGISKLA